MQHVLVDLRYKKAYIFNNLIKCNFCNFTLWMPPYLGCPGPSPRSPPPLHATVLSCCRISKFSNENFPEAATRTLLQWPSAMASSYYVTKENSLANIKSIYKQIFNLYYRIYDKKLQDHSNI